MLREGFGRERGSLLISTISLTYCLHDVVVQGKVLLVAGLLEFVDVDVPRSVAVVLQEGLGQRGEVDVVVLTQLSFDLSQKPLQVIRSEGSKIKKVIIKGII